MILSCSGPSPRWGAYICAYEPYHPRLGNINLMIFIANTYWLLARTCALSVHARGQVLVLRSLSEYHPKECNRICLLSNSGLCLYSAACIRKSACAVSPKSWQCYIKPGLRSSCYNITLFPLPSQKNAQKNYNINPVHRSKNDYGYN